MEDFKLGDLVVYPDYYETEVFTVVGLTFDKLLLRGDWSGGTNIVSGESWVDRNKVFKNINGTKK
jgi:hypothetical protein